MTKIQKKLFLLIILIAFILRIYGINKNPPGLYWDEAAFGYDAYSISQIGRDHHGRFLPLFFESFGDWKLPVYFYLLVPFVKTLGLSEFSVRIPSAIFGASTVFAIFYLTRKLTKNTNLSLSVMFILAISPWHIQFSRGGFESTVGLFFVVLAVTLLVKWLEKKNSKLLFLSAILFVLSMYTYHAYRIFTPALVVTLFFLFYTKYKNNLSLLFMPFALALALTLPLLIFTLSKEGRARAISQSAFSMEEMEKVKIEYDQKSKKPLRFLSRYLYQRPFYYSQIAFKSYINHFSPTFLFLRGDQIGRHSQVDIGQIYFFELALITIAFFNLKKVGKSVKKLFFVWLLLAPLPATIVQVSPHAYRSLQMIIPLSFLSGLGLYSILSLKKYSFIKISAFLIILYFFINYLHLLTSHYPKKFAADWQDGNREMVQLISKHQASYEKIYITSINSLPYIYLLFYQQYDPKKFISGGGTENSFDKYIFVERNADVYNKGKLLYLSPSWEKVDGSLLGQASDNAGRHIYSLWEVGGQN